ncbi:MAG: glucosamine--fructose-6-phosphate aminotransferase [Deltaproteobacteria bacterium RIFOXYB12_FULL_58_9]|nr:MAG: glucosamine--fructose-6-phosphate aminotransferase [Deltaproteobacteria bacterium RIFOXYB12_FULL_58_9]
MALREEIFEQPTTLARLLANQRANITHIASELQRRTVHFVMIAARGSSDNAARYAKYVWGSRNRLPVALAAPSLFNHYNAPPKLDGALVVGISQSGQSPDIVNVVSEGRRQGAATLAITNTPDSPLGRAAEWVINLEAGAELSVAATKTYTAELMVIAMLSAALDKRTDAWTALDGVPAAVDGALAHESVISSAAERLQRIDQCVVLARGFNYATAFELSLKLKELTYVVAEPYSCADFQHGPIAIVDHGFVVIGILPTGTTSPQMRQFLQDLHQQRRVELLTIADDPDLLALGDYRFPIPQLPEWLSPIAAIVPGQLFGHHLTLAKGYDPEHPRGLHKVTETT